MSYSFAQLESLWRRAGGSAKLEATMAAIGLAESHGDPHAQHQDSDGSIDRGLWQENSSHGYGTRSFDPQESAKEAVSIEHSQGLDAWSTYRSGAYKRFMPKSSSSRSRPRGAPGAATSKSGVAFVEAASRYIGTPYVWGGESPRGFDCSGLVEFVLTRMGLHGVPRTSEAQFAWADTVAARDLKAGMLVFLNFPGEFSPGHVMIYAGGNRVIQAPKPGGNVEEVSFDPKKPGSNEWGAKVVGYGKVPGLDYKGEPAGPLSGPVTLGVPVPPVDHGAAAGTGGGDVGQVAGGGSGLPLVDTWQANIGSGGLFGVFDETKDFLKAALWLINPLNWLRLFELLVGATLMLLGFLGLGVVLVARSDVVQEGAGLASLAPGPLGAAGRVAGLTGQAARGRQARRATVAERIPQRVAVRAATQQGEREERQSQRRAAIAQARASGRRRAQVAQTRQRSDRFGEVPF